MRRLKFPRAGWAASFVVVSAALLTGCAVYQAKPLDEGAVAGALRAPSWAAVKLAATQIDHPLLPAQVIDGEGGFTPEEIGLIALIASPQLRAIRDQRGLAQAQVIAAGILPNPQFGFSADVPHGNVDPSLVAARSLGLSWDLTALLSLHQKKIAAQKSSEAIDLEIAWQEWQVARTAELRAGRVLSLEESLPLAQEIEAGSGENLALLKKAFALGQQTRSDLTLATAAWRSARDQRFTMAQDLTRERIALNLMLGQPAEVPVPLKASPIEARPTVATLGELLAGLETHRLDLVALKLGYESQEASLRAAIRSQFPKINLSLTQARDTGLVKTRGYGVAIDVPLFDRNQATIAHERATRQQLFDDYVARVAEARSEVVQLQAALSGTRGQLSAIDTELISLRELVEASDREYQAEGIDVLTWREARHAWLGLRLGRERVRQNYQELQLALGIASGRPTSN